MQMKITTANYCPYPNVLIDKLRQVTLKDSPDLLPYKDAYISVIQLHTDALAPCQTYVLQSELEKVRQLDWALKQYGGYGVTDISGFIEYQTEDGQTHTLLPPVVEESIEGNSRIYYLINDGMHRLYMARLYHDIPTVAFVRGAKFPYYAYPLPGGWNDVKEVKDLPEGFIKKWHRIPNYKSLYRDFNSAFANVGESRGRFVK